MRIRLANDRIHVVAGNEIDSLKVIPFVCPVVGRQRVHSKELPASGKRIKEKERERDSAV